MMSSAARSSATFNPTSGLSYIETTIPAARGPTSRILSIRSASNQHPGASTPKLRNGLQSLQDLSTRTFLANTNHVDSNTLIGLPYTPIGARLWQRVEAENLTTPTIWSAFCHAFPEEEEFQFYTVSDIAPKRTMPEFISLLSSPRRGLNDFYWLTAFTICNLDMTRNDLLGIARIPNLVALDIQSRDSASLGDIDDRVVRAWSEQASAEGAFSKLQVLIFRNLRHVTRRTLEYLASFPSLALFGVRNCSLTKADEQAAKLLGWTTNDEHGIIAAVHRDITMSHTSHGTLYGCIRRSKCLLDAYRANDSVNSRISDHMTTSADPIDSHDPPLLSYRIGRPDSDYSLFGDRHVGSPLMFFKSTKHDASDTCPPPISHAARQIWPADYPGTESKKRKLRHHMTMTEVWQESGIGAEAGKEVKGDVKSQ